MRPDNPPREGLDELLAMLPSPSPPPELKRRVMSAVRARPRLTFARRWMPLALGATAVLAVMLLRPAEPQTIPVGSDDLQVQALVAYHTVALTSDPLSDPAAMAALSADAARRGVGAH